MPTPLESALAWATQDIAVLPVWWPLFDNGVARCACPDKYKREGKCKPAKHPIADLVPRSYLDATLDPAVIADWWSRYPDANVAIALPQSGLIDIAPDSVAWLEEFRARGLPETICWQSSAEGHVHFLYRRPADCPIARIARRGEYDVLTDGYAVAPYSLHASGERYRLLSLPGTRLADAEAWKVEMLQEHVAQRQARAVRVTAPPDEGVDAEPPVRLDAEGMAHWRGERLLADDRSQSLVNLAQVLRDAGATRRTGIDAIAERDETLGWETYTNRGDREVRYAEIWDRYTHVNAKVSGSGGSKTHQPPPRQDARVWPEPLGEAAYHGPLGGVVRGIEPYTEADPAALLAHAIVFAGAHIGRDVAIEAEDDEHPPRFYCTLVGNTSKGRKGTAAGPFRKVAAALYEPMHVASGLSSSEGLIKLVRDPVEKWDVKEQKKVIADQGVTDKRVVLIESEFGGVLKRMQREGNALSATLRDGWDHGNLATLVSRNPLTATNAHINLIAHITHDELKQCLAEVEVSNGLVNRMLWFAVKRWRLIPRSKHQAEVETARNAFKEALRLARAWVQNPAQHRHKLTWSDAAGDEFDALYEDLSAEHVGMFGQATQRAETHVLRLCVLYAVLDKSMTVEPEHLHAALAVWKYCEQSSRWIFAGNTGNPNADRILAALRASGEMTRTEISALFGRNLNAAAIGLALETLVNHGLAAFEQRASGSYKSEVWWAL